MEILISWSGDASKQVADVFYDWLPNMFHAIKPWMSEYDIDKGDHWNAVLDSKLQNSNCGLVCLTPDNLNNPWILYEAGSISKSLQSRTWTFLYNLRFSDVRGPLTRFQHTLQEESDVLKLMKSINHMLGEESLDEKRLFNQFKKWWPELENGLNNVKENVNMPIMAKKRENRELIEEILDLVRQQSKYRSIGSLELVDISPMNIKMTVKDEAGLRLIRFSRDMDFYTIMDSDSSTEPSGPSEVGEFLTNPLKQAQNKPLQNDKNKRAKS